MADVVLKPTDAQALAEATATRRRAEDDALRASKAQYAAIRHAVKNGASLREVAEAVGMSHQMVHKITERHP